MIFSNVSYFYSATKGRLSAVIFLVLCAVIAVFFLCALIICVLKKKHVRNIKNAVIVCIDFAFALFILAVFVVVLIFKTDGFTVKDGSSAHHVLSLCGSPLGIVTLLFCLIVSVAFMVIYFIKTYGKYKEQKFIVAAEKSTEVPKFIPAVEALVDIDEIIREEEESFKKVNDSLSLAFPASTFTTGSDFTNSFLKSLEEMDEEDKVFDFEPEKIDIDFALEAKRLAGKKYNIKNPFGEGGNAKSEEKETDENLEEGGEDENYGDFVDEIVLPITDSRLRTKDGKSLADEFLPKKPQSVSKIIPSGEKIPTTKKPIKKKTSGGYVIKKNPDISKMYAQYLSQKTDDGVTVHLENKENPNNKNEESLNNQNIENENKEGD